MLNIFKPKKEIVPEPADTHKEKQRALERNKEAKRRFDKALEKLKPMRDLSDFLGDT